MIDLENLDLKLFQHDDEGLRVATPIPIAKSKAERLSNETIADLGSGIGVQSIVFSYYFHKVYSVERTGRIRYAKRNAKKFGIRNIEFIKGDALNESVIKKLKDVDVIFSDPSRPVRKGEWDLEDLSPSPLKIIKYYKNDAFVFDIPVQMRMNKLDDEWEKEYISLDGEIKRLSIYLGKVKNYDRSALILPEGIRVIYNPQIERKINVMDEPLDYVYDVDPAIQYAELLPEIIREMGDLYLLLKDKKRCFLTSKNFKEKEYFRSIYVIDFYAENMNALIQKLRENNAGKIYLRYNVNADEYYIIKEKIEKNLQGKEKYYIFRFKEKFYVGREIFKRFI